MTRTTYEICLVLLGVAGLATVIGAIVAGTTMVEVRRRASSGQPPSLERLQQELSDLNIRMRQVEAEIGSIAGAGKSYVPSTAGSDRGYPPHHAFGNAP